MQIIKPDLAKYKELLDEFEERGMTQLHEILQAKIDQIKRLYNENNRTES